MTATEKSVAVFHLPPPKTHSIQHLEQIWNLLFRFDKCYFLYLIKDFDKFLTSSVSGFHLAPSVKIQKKSLPDQEKQEGDFFTEKSPRSSEPIMGLTTSSEHNLNELSTKKKNEQLFFGLLDDIEFKSTIVDISTR